MAIMKLTILTSRFPYPIEKGDKLRIYNQIKQLSKKHEITLIALNFTEVSAEQRHELEKYCKVIYTFKISPVHQFINIYRSIFNGLPLQVGLFYQDSLKKKIHRIISETKPDALYCHLIRMSEYVKEIKNVNKTLDYMDVFSKGMQRRAERSGFGMRQIALLEYNRLLRYENSIFDYFENKVIISEQDKHLIPHADKNKIHVIENGVDTEIFYPISCEKKYDLLFTGNMAYPPNIEAAIYTVKKIMPMVHQINPKINLLIAGIQPSASVRALQSDKIDVIDNFKHIREAFAMSRVNLAPMLTSIGLQNKILQAMAMKVPTVSSSLANNAVKAIDGKSILVADTAEQYAGKIIEILSDAKKAEQIAEEGYRFVKTHYDWELQNEKLEKIIFS
jgi:sugar transferase (PEP-CTERM/EpsH1 system associated)